MKQSGSRLTGNNDKNEVLAIIPARGGSKRIPKKNIADLCGKPLIYYTINAALMTERITRVVVSTDDEEIAKLSEHHGAEVPFMRPSRMAVDEVNVSAAVNHTIQELKSQGYQPEFFTVLYPTHVFRNPRLLNRLVLKLIEGYQTVYTVKAVKRSGMRYFSRDEKDRLVPVKPICPHSKALRHYGLFSGYSLKGPNSGIYYEEVSDSVSLIDIDTFSDLELARKVIRHRLFDFDLK